MYDILVYLFENCSRPNWLTTRARRQEALGGGLRRLGHKRSAALASRRAARAARGAAKLPDSRTSFRAFAPRELTKTGRRMPRLPPDAGAIGILNPQTRELVIERSLAATGDSLTLDQLKLIVLMVLWNQQMPTSRLVAEDLFSAPRARLPN